MDDPFESYTRAEIVAAISQSPPISTANALLARLDAARGVHANVLCNVAPGPHPRQKACDDLDARLAERERDSADLEPPSASIYANGTWHTWDERGVGGENGCAANVFIAAREAADALVRQGYAPAPAVPSDALLLQHGLVHIADAQRSLEHAADRISKVYEGIGSPPEQRPRFGAMAGMSVHESPDAWDPEELVKATETDEDEEPDDLVRWRAWCSDLREALDKHLAASAPQGTPSRGPHSSLPVCDHDECPRSECTKKDGA